MDSLDPEEALGVTAEVQRPPDTSATMSSTGPEVEWPEVEWLDWGTLDYESSHQRQLARVGERREHNVIDAIVTVSHPHVITIGRRRGSDANVLAPGDVPVVEVERGGDVTYHGPGQLVAYPIVHLQEGERDLHLLLRNLEEAMIATCSHYGLDTGREEGKTGVWREGRKLASIGIACRRWVTFHGIALNVSTDLSYFGRINPCGFDSVTMTSMEQELGRSLDFDDVRSRLVADLSRCLRRTPVAS